MFVFLEIDNTFRKLKLCRYNLVFLVYKKSNMNKKMRENKNTHRHTHTQKFQLQFF